jgi:hypothetical protein
LSNIDLDAAMAFAKAGAVALANTANATPEEKLSYEQFLFKNKLADTYANWFEWTWGSEAQETRERIDDEIESVCSDAWSRGDAERFKADAAAYVINRVIEYFANR